MDLVPLTLKNPTLYTKPILTPVVCTNSKYTKPPVVHRGQMGENVVEHFLDGLLQEEEEEYL